ncbi:hypothetical protein [Sphingomonas lenta]|uniref:DUF2059 domain-containing protein n=1 Tax=Sphingomonas lenta TaxID=1141887 RepID=A0A2A2SF30_9SPHN|nr:hypothetical protein [Sphingomonas lenta]PAX07802.1 hypothetical protein CKY28_09235 [Sphingomonas lenta]
MLILALLLAQAAPSAEALSLGEEVARSGTLASIAPAIAAKDTEDLVAEHPELSEGERAELRKVGASTFAAGSARLYAAMGEEYARRLSIEDMRAVLAFNRSPAAARYRAAELPAIAAAQAKMGRDMDLKNGIRTAYCKQTGKLCPKP